MKYESLAMRKAFTIICSELDTFDLHCISAFLELVSLSGSGESAWKTKGDPKVAE